MPRIRKLVLAATAVSSPAHCGITTSHAAASGAPVSFRMPTTSAPPRRAARASSIRSGLRPDCEIARNSAPSSTSEVPYVETMLGPIDATGSPSVVSIRYFP